MLTERMMDAPRPYAPAFRRIRYAARYLRAFLSAIVADPEVILRKTGKNDHPGQATTGDDRMHSRAWRRI